MKTMLQVQLESKALPEEARRDLVMVLGEMDRLIAKLTQLLRYAKPAVRPGAVPQRMEAIAVAEQVVGLLRNEAQRRGGRLDLADHSGGATVGGSEESLADILSNLVVNAIEVMPQGGVVTVNLGREDGSLLIDAIDDGPGIPPENLPRLFKPFFTTKPSGTGLGLAIVERRVTELGGSVSCESPAANARGAKFRVRLPLA
jgi:two-component system sensor histidine kinase HydH